ncbi:GNAT family N-acetyltransferase [Candidatus Omnitrophota bacterium]
MASVTPKFIPIGKENLNGENIFKFQVKDIFFHRFLKRNDVVTIKETDISRIKPGDFVFGRNTFLQEGIFQVLKKIREVDTIALEARNEYGLYFNDKLYPQELIGRLISIERKGQIISFSTFKYSFIKKIEISLVNLREKFGEFIQVVHGSEVCGYLVKRVFSMVRFQYRIASIEDVPGIAGLLVRHYWPMPIQEINKKIYCLFSELLDNGYCFVACRKDKIVGFMTAKKECSADGQEHSWYLDMLYVSPLYRRLKIGLHLFLLVCREGYKRNILEFSGMSVERIYLSVKKGVKDFNLEEFISFSIEEKSALASDGLPCKQLQYSLRITNPEKLMKCCG